MKDWLEVDQVRLQLEALGIEVWLAEHDPRPGTSILSKIEAVLPTCDAVVFLITNNSVDSAYVHQEVGLARAHGKVMVPLVERQVDKSRLGLLGELEWIEIDLQNPSLAFANVTKSLQPLLTAQLTSMAGSPQGAGGFNLGDPTLAFLVGALTALAAIVISILILRASAASA
jgi:hypothetical protein